jgi:predicted AAA+ superfamily ATPase
MQFYQFNPWWKDGKVPSEIMGKRRRIFHEIIRYLDKRQILVFTGLRRVGKTTLMYQIIDEILKKGEKPHNIFYFSFDEKGFGLEEILKQFEIEILRGDLSRMKTYIFLDEIQKLEDWPSKIKLLYDMSPKIKIFLSGSAQITMWRGTRESLAGRFFDFNIQPLDFEEYLEFKGLSRL